MKKKSLKNLKLTKQTITRLDMIRSKGQGTTDTVSLSIEKDGCNTEEYNCEEDQGGTR